ncbi:DUF366 family protein [Desulfotomaculum copahuensis]|uniref:DUF366 domain-containing protein n=1 Tax=Desulfotomaculum copahuensis TaxID=1838280 RepID=A0A1B7LE27_9FIRM|nr:DUF366 family protein [Desulfotomaculum copahuensis]OAT81349.1 hypothetical protein A6M21_10735 [Desulfotomaculum copahuensis]
MHTFFIEKTMLYDGTQLSSLWAYRTLGLPGDSIVAFRGPCRLDFAHMVDMEDVLQQSPIYGSDMLHFIIEHFDAGLGRTILRQRLLVAIINEIVSSRGSSLKRDGDDLYLAGRKLSISIATVTPVSTMIHTALNVTAENTPVPAASLVEMGWSGNEIPALAEKIFTAYAAELESVKRARCKVRGVN